MGGSFGDGPGDVKAARPDQETAPATGQRRADTWERWRLAGTRAQGQPAGRQRSQFTTYEK